jgi:hypothetical protein
LSDGLSLITELNQILRISPDQNRKAIEIDFERCLLDRIEMFGFPKVNTEGERRGVTVDDGCPAATVIRKVECRVRVVSNMSKVLYGPARRRPLGPLLMNRLHMKRHADSGANAELPTMRSKKATTAANLMGRSEVLHCTSDVRPIKFRDVRFCCPRANPLRTCAAFPIDGSRICYTADRRASPK